MEIFKLVGRVAYEGQAQVEKGLQALGKQVKTTKDRFDEMGKKSTQIGKSMQGVGKGMSKWVTAPILAVGAGMTGMAMNTSQAADRIDKMSQRLGLSRSAFQEWDFILSQSGSSIDSMQAGMKNLSQRMNESMQGAGKGAELFDQLGISITDSMSQEEAFELTIRAFQDMEDGVEKAALAQQMFGRSGQELLPLLNSSRGSLDEMKETYAALGMEINDETIDAGVKFTDTMDQIKRTAQALAVQIGGDLLPIFQSFADWFLSTGAPKIREFTGRIQDLASWFTQLSPHAQKVIVVVAGIAAAIGPAIAGFGTFLVVLGKILPALGGLLSPTTAVIAIIAALVAGLIYAYTQSETFRNIVDTAFRAVMDLGQQAFGAITALIPPAMAGLRELGEALKAMGRAMMEAYQQSETFQAILRTVFNALVAVVQMVFNNIVGVIKGAFNMIMGAVQIFTGLFSGNWSQMWDGVKQLLSGTLQFIWNLIQLTFMGRILGIVRGFATAGIAAFRGFFTNASSIFTNLGSTVTRIFTAIRTTITNMISSATNAATGVIRGFTNAAGNLFRGFLNLVTSILNSKRNMVNSVFSAIGRVITTLISSATSAAGRAISGLLTTARNNFNNILSTARSVFNNVRSAITTPINSAVSAVSRSVDRIKRFFSNMKLSIPKISMPKLPRFSLTGNFSLKPPSVPRISVDWYAKGGIFSDASVIGVGEKPGEKEAVLPLNSSVLGEIGRGIASTMQPAASTRAAASQQVIHSHIYLDGEEIAESLEPIVSSIQGSQYNSRTRILGGKT